MLSELSLLLALISAESAPEPVRYGVFVGTNAAPATREPLRHAEADAERIRRVFVELGGISEPDAVLLLRPSASDILGTLERLASRIPAQEQAMFVFYYSGHADDRALLLGSSELPLTELRSALERFPARVALHLLDACRSGALTRRKGMQLGRPFSIRSTPAGEGRVVITSSAEWEDSQESDRLGGSFFTVHLASGLRGAADHDADGRVTIAEAYGYVYGRTLESTLATVAGPQHPTFLYDIRGQGDWVLTWSNAGEDLATLNLASDGDYLVLDGSSGGVLAEVRAQDQPQRLRLRAGDYRLSKRTQSELWEGRLRIEANRVYDADQALTVRTTHARLVRKGGGPSLSHSLWIEGGVRGAVGEWLALSPMARVGYGIDLPFLSLRPRLSFAGAALGASAIGTPRLVYDSSELGFGLELRRDFDLPFVTVGGGLLSELVHLSQAEQSDLEPDRNALGFVLGGLIGAQSRPFHHFTLRLSAELAAYSFPATSVDRNASDEGNLETALSYRTMLGVGYEL